MNPPEPTLAELIEPEMTALIVVDMQNDYCSKDGGMQKLLMKVDFVQEMAPRLASFIRSCRKHGISIIHTMNTHSDFTDTESWRRLGGSRLNLARRGSEGEKWFGK
ncbi:MAG: cysteine hydrolase family protein [Thaumarchaeota archaeon]|nr:cysteine hydrolase family protein [Nitrososphaerota archaeon]MDG6906257.1 cysteine hydrolase family protein [Nitrososphaerota archaeon]